MLHCNELGSMSMLELYMLVPALHYSFPVLLVLAQRYLSALVLGHLPGR
jgi:hypothetical protein